MGVRERLRGLPSAEVNEPLSRATWDVSRQYDSHRTSASRAQRPAALKAPSRYDTYPPVHTRVRRHRAGALLAGPTGARSPPPWPVRGLAGLGRNCPIHLVSDSERPPGKSASRLAPQSPGCPGAADSKRVEMFSLFSACDDEKLASPLTQTFRAWYDRCRNVSGRSSQGFLAQLRQWARTGGDDDVAENHSGWDPRTCRVDAASYGNHGRFRR